MSEQPVAARSRTATIATNALLAACACGLAFASYALFNADRVLRRPAQKLVERYTMPIRRPDTALTLAYAPSADFADDLVGDATLRDVLSPVSLTGLAPNVREAWIDSVQTHDLQMQQAISVMLDALSQRPGWPYHSTLLGQLVYTRDAQRLSPDIIAKYRRWSVPLNVGARGAPSDSDLWQFLAIAYLQTWPDLAGAHERAAPAVFRNAFADPEFVRATFAQAARILGTDAAVAVLPDSPRPIRAAYELLADSGAIESAWRLHQRWDIVEWRQRERDLRQLESIAARGDVEEIRQACHAWALAHSVWDYDTPAARQQAARILDLWPVSDAGRWPGDPRMEMINYFLAGRRDAVDGAVLARAAAAVSGIPASRQAQLHVLASDIAGGESIANSTDSFGTFEWTPYIVDLSRYWLRHGNRQKAQSTLAALAPAAHQECEATLAQNEANNHPLPETPADVNVEWTRRVNVPLCLSKRAGAHATLTLLNGSPVIVDFGWDRARSGSVLLREGQPAAVILPPMDGYRAMTVSATPDSTESTIALRVSPSS